MVQNPIYEPHTAVSLYPGPFTDACMKWSRHRDHYQICVRLGKLAGADEEGFLTN